jgi:hypothetical protein
MARKKKAAVEEYTGSVYGIDKDGNVASVSIYRKGSNIRLSRMFGDGRMFPHSITHPTSVVAEAALVAEAQPGSRMPKRSLTAVELDPEYGLANTLPSGMYCVVSRLRSLFFIGSDHLSRRLNICVTTTDGGNRVPPVGGEEWHILHKPMCT